MKTSVRYLIICIPTHQHFRKDGAKAGSLDLLGPNHSLAINLPIDLNSLPISSLVSSMRSLNQIISKVPTSNDILGLGKGWVIFLGFASFNNFMKNSLSSRVPWHNLPPLGQVATFLKTSWGLLVLTFQSERTDAELEGSGPGSMWPGWQPLTFLPTEAQFCAGWHCHCKPISLARCFLSQPFLQEEVTMQPGSDWCGIESRLLGAFVSFADEKRTTGTRPKKPLLPPPPFSLLPYFYGNHDARNCSSHLRPWPALGWRTDMQITIKRTWSMMMLLSYWVNSSPARPTPQTSMNKTSLPVTVSWILSQSKSYSIWRMASAQILAKTQNVHE